MTAYTFTACDRNKPELVLHQSTILANAESDVIKYAEWFIAESCWSDAIVEITKKDVDPW